MKRRAFREGWVCGNVGSVGLYLLRVGFERASIGRKWRCDRVCGIPYRDLLSFLPLHVYQSSSNVFINGIVRDPLID